MMGYHSEAQIAAAEERSGPVRSTAGAQQQEEEEVTETTMLPEAPASVTVKFNFHGYDTMLTLRGHSGAEVLPKLDTALAWLEDHGASATAAPAANGHKPEAKVCPIHGAKMTRREKNGDEWYSHKFYTEDGAEKWCRGKEK